MNRHPIARWRSRRNARRAHRRLMSLIPGVFGGAVSPGRPESELVARLRLISMDGFRGEWPVVQLAGETIAVVPAMTATVGNCRAVPGVDHEGRVAYLVFGIGDGAFLSHQAEPVAAVDEAARLRPHDAAESPDAWAGSHQPVESLAGL